MTFQLPAPYKKLVDYLKTRIAVNDRIYIQAHLPYSRSYALAGSVPRPVFISPKGIRLLVEKRDGEATSSERFIILWEPKTKLWKISATGKPSVKVNTLAGVNTLLNWHFN